jgi:NAD(P)H-dependent flavin oxidoreductase YrpB (nitropropane dioxygenase family)
LQKKRKMRAVDAVVAEGFEAGGHNGEEETTTMILVPAVGSSVQIPVIAAGWYRHRQTNAGSNGGLELRRRK